MSTEIAKELEATSQALAAADQAHLHVAFDGAAWERRGILQRLSRTDRPHAVVVHEPQAWTPASAGADAA